MNTLQTYLIGLQSKIFKLLPMREAYDNGETNHLEKYLENLCITYTGAFDCFPQLTEIKEAVEVQSNIFFLKNNIDVDFKKWRATVLRSSRLMRTVIGEHSEEVKYGN